MDHDFIIKRCDRIGELLDWLEEQIKLNPGQLINVHWKDKPKAEKAYFRSVMGGVIHDMRSFEFGVRAAILDDKRKNRGGD